VGVDEVGESPVLKYIQQVPVAAAPAAAGPAGAPGLRPSAPARPAAPAPKAAAPAPKPAAAQSAAPKAAPADVAGTPIKAPMPGMIVRYAKNVGDAVNQGDTVVILEAMKMENALNAPASGTIKAINFKSGDSVAKNDVLCVIG